MVILGYFILRTPVSVEVNLDILVFFFYANIKDLFDFQVMIRYGKFSNATLLLDFGFTLQHNLYDQVECPSFSKT